MHRASLAVGVQSVAEAAEQSRGVAAGPVRHPRQAVQRVVVVAAGDAVGAHHLGAAAHLVVLKGSDSSCR